MPLLPFVLPYEASETVMVSLICITLIVSMNLWFFNRQGLVSWVHVWSLGLLAALGGFMASMLALMVNGEVIRWLTGALLFLLSLRMIFYGKKDVPEIFKKNAALMPMSYIAGGFSGLVGVGTGAIMGPVMFGTKLIPDEKISPTINGMLVLSAVTASATYIWKSLSGDWIELQISHLEVIVIIGVFSVASAYWGRKQQLGISPSLRRNLLGGILLILAASTIFPLVL